MTDLYPYQKSAVDLITTKGRALIAYEMGLGKTPITIRAMEQMMEDGTVRNTVLVIVLSSLRYQWKKEIEKWAPNSTAAIIDGGPKDRDELYAKLEVESPDYVISTYDLVVRDYSWYAAHRWGAIVLDEMTAIKSFRAKRTQAIKRLSMRVPVRVGLTGTPITNGKADEIFSLMEFVDPTVLGKFWDFDKRYIVRHPNGWITKYKNLPELHTRLTPHIARKRQMDADVKSFLPEVLDMPARRVVMDRYTKRIYKVISQDLLRFLDEAMDLFGGSFTWNMAANYGHGDAKFDPMAMQVQGNIMQTYQALRMLCDHPQLLIDSALEFAQDEGKGSGYCYQLHTDKMVGLLDNQKSPKLVELIAYLKDAIEADPEVKVVVFASWTRAFPYLLQAMAQAKIVAVQFHGGMTPTAKEAAKTKFQTDQDVRVFLSSDAGGYGVDLPQASILINYNLPWSAGAALQRNSRIIRASSGHKQVRIERLLMDDSVEIRQFQVLGHKMSVSQGIIDGVGIDPMGNLENTVAGLRSFLLDNDE
jgi:SNF2 family DNA or RNA helicase